MNQFLPSRFVENIRRLAVGLEPIDSGRGTLVAHRLVVDFDSLLLRSRQRASRPLDGPRIDPHVTNRYVLLFHPAVGNRVDIRIQDPARRFVPRRLRIPIRPAATADNFPQSDRVRRPVMFPGAAYDLTSGATALRGRVTRAGAPARWARVEAVRGANVVARAHGDDRGEFLLVLDPTAPPPGDLDLRQPLRLNVTAKAPQAAPVPNPPAIEKQDPLWDLPIEIPNSINDPDPVQPEDEMFRGSVDPQGYNGAATVPVDFHIGQVVSNIEFAL